MKATTIHAALLGLFLTSVGNAQTAPTNPAPAGSAFDERHSDATFWCDVGVGFAGLSNKGLTSFILRRPDDFAHALSQFDVRARLGTTDPVSLNEFLDYTGDQGQRWTREQRKAWRKIIRDLDRHLAPATATRRYTGSMKTIAMMTTTDSVEHARTMATALVERRLAACVQISGIESVYTWQNKTENDTEFRLLIKTTADRYAAVEAAIRELHTYDLPAIYSLPLEHVFEPYAEWVAEHSHAIE